MLGHNIEDGNSIFVMMSEDNAVYLRVMIIAIIFVIS